MEQFDSQKIQQLFTACDLNGSGFVELEDLKELCSDLSINEIEIEEVFEQLDQNGDGKVSSREFAEGFENVQRLFAKRARTTAPRNGATVPGLTHRIRPSERAWEEYAATVGPALYMIPGQESICELYQDLHKSNIPHLLSSYEKVIYEVIKDIKQQQSEINRLEQSFKRAREAHAAHLRQLESESEAHAIKVEARIRQQEKEIREAETQEIKRHLNNEIQELENNLKKYQTVEARLQTRDKPRDDLMQTLRKEVDELRQENRQLKSSLTELQTNLALAKSENLELKSEYDDQMGFITSNRETLQEYIKEHENLTRQLEMLHEANKKLQDTNDDLRAALENLQKNVRSPQANRHSVSRSSSVQSYDSRQLENNNSLRRRQFPYQASVDSNDIADLQGRHGNYMITRYNDVDSIPDDVDSGNSTLRDPNELLDLEGEEDSRRPPPISEEVVTVDSQVSGDVMSPRKSRSSPGYSDKTFERNSSARSSRSSTKSGRKRALPQIPTKPVAPQIPQGTPERMYKIVLAGDAAVGKSSFILRLCKGIFHNNLNSTLGVDFQVRTMDIDGRITSVQLWDTAGQERFRSIAKSYFRRADGVLLLYDCTFERSFINVRDWIEAVEDGAQKTVPIMICSNKVDLRASAMAEGVRCVRTEDGERLASSFDALFIETSAKDNCNIEEAVIQLVRTLHKNEDMEVGNGAMTLSTEEITKKEQTFSCCNS